jgi:hypothetical protein
MDWRHLSEILAAGDSVYRAPRFIPISSAVVSGGASSSVF